MTTLKARQNSPEAVEDGLEGDTMIARKQRDDIIGLNNLTAYTWAVHVLVARTLLPCTIECI